MRATVHPTVTSPFSRAAELIALLLRAVVRAPAPTPKRRVAGLSFDDIVDASSRATDRNRLQLQLQRRTKVL